MKKYLSTILLLAAAVGSSYAQSTPAKSDAALLGQADQIANETQAGQNTALRIGNMFRAIIVSKPSVTYAGETTGTNTYSATPLNPISSYRNGDMFLVRFANSNSTAATLNLGFGARNIVNNKGFALTSGEIPAGSYQWLVYNSSSTHFKAVTLDGVTGGGGSGTVESVTGTVVDNTDPDNPVINAQEPLVSATNIKTVNGNTLLGSGDLVIGGDVPSTRTISTTAPLSGGGDLSANRTLSIAPASTSNDGYITSTNWNTFNDKQPALISGTNIKTVNGTSLLGSGNITISGGSSTFASLTDGPGALTGNGLNFVRVNTGATALEYQTPSQVKTAIGLGSAENTALSTWAGSTNLTTLGTIGTGTWQGSLLSSTYGGTGVNNGGRTLTLNTNSGTLTYSNAATTLTVANTGSISGTNTGDQTITLTGDVTGNGTGSFATTLAASGASAGSYTKTTVNTKGLVTAGTNQETQTFDTKTANYTLVLGDADKKTIIMNVATPNTFTVPTNGTVAFPIGTIINGMRTGAGPTTVTPADGTVTITSSSGSLVDPGANIEWTIKKTGTNTWILQNGLPSSTATSGTYTPTLTNTTNVAASTAYTLVYYRVGNAVTVSGRVDVDPTSTGSVVLTISLPIASNFTTANQAGGAAHATAIAGQGAAMISDSTADSLVMQWVAVDITNQPMYFTATYQVL